MKMDKLLDWSATKLQEARNYAQENIGNVLSQSRTCTRTHTLVQKESFALLHPDKPFEGLWSLRWLPPLSTSGVWACSWPKTCASATKSFCSKSRTPACSHVTSSWQTATSSSSSLSCCCRTLAGSTLSSQRRGLGQVGETWRELGLHELTRLWCDAISRYWKWRV